MRNGLILMKSFVPPHVEHRTFNQLGIVLIVISSGLLGIWAVRDTIALRNIFLALGSLLSLIYWYIYFKNQKKLSINSRNSRKTCKNITF